GRREQPRPGSAGPRPARAAAACSGAATLTAAVGIRALPAAVARRPVGERGRAPRHGIARVRGAGIAVVAADRRALAASRVAEVLARAGVAVVARPAVQQRRVVHAPGTRFVAPVGGAGVAVAASARHCPAAGALVTHAADGAEAA